MINPTDPVDPSAFGPGLSIRTHIATECLKALIQSNQATSMDGTAYHAAMYADFLIVHLNKQDFPIKAPS
jgi:hypothetical protein